MVVKLRLSGARVLVCDFHGYLGPQSGLNCRSYITNHDILVYFSFFGRCFHDFLLGRDIIVKVSKLISLPDLIRLEVK